MALINTRSIRDIHYNDLFPEICDQLVELFTLSGKYQDDEKIKVFGKHLSNDLPGSYPYLTIPDLAVIFKNAIRGEYGDLKSIDLPSIFKWVRKWQETSEIGQKTAIMSLASESSEHTDWSHEVYKAYQKYLLTGIKHHEISHCLYDRMLLDGMIEMESYQKWLEKAAQLIKLEPDPENLLIIRCAQRIKVLEKFNQLKERGVREIYIQHKKQK